MLTAVKGLVTEVRSLATQFRDPVTVLRTTLLTTRGGPAWQGLPKP